MFAWDKTFQDWLATDLRPCRMTYEATEWFTTNLRRLATKGGSSCELGHSQVKLTSTTTVYLCGASLKKLTMVKILHIVRVPHACGGEFGEFNSNKWDVIWSSALKDRAFWHGIKCKCLHSYQAVRELRNRKVCAAFYRCAFGLIVSNRVNLYYKRHIDCNTVGTFITRPNISCYYLQHCNDSSRT